MFDSFRDKLYSVVQDGIILNNTVRRKISEAQSSSKTNTKLHDSYGERINYAAGSELLAKYQKDWTELHENAERNAKQAEKVDVLMAGISRYTKLQLDSVSSINSSLYSLPKVISAVEQCGEQLRRLTDKFCRLETDLIALEAIIDKGDYQQRMTEHKFQLIMYKERKLASLEDSRVQLAAQQAAAARDTELKQRNLLKERQRAAQVAFQEDLHAFKTQGTLPAKRSNQSSANSSQPSLEEITLDVDDHGDLDQFLSS